VCGRCVLICDGRSVRQVRLTHRMHRTEASIFADASKQATISPSIDKVSLTLT